MTIADKSHRWDDGDHATSELSFTLEDFQGLAEIVSAESGIRLTESKAPLVYARLARRLRVLTLPSFLSYRNFIASPEGVRERQFMVEAMTTNVTQFFREPHHFTSLTRDVLPTLIQQARAGGRVRLWSAGCSSGEEPYSIAATVLSMMPDVHQHDFKILATDINSQMLAMGRAGVYASDGTDDATLGEHGRWFRRETVGGKSRLLAHDDLRRIISFRTSNLVSHPWPMNGKFQVIFCRNVLIYFESDIRDGICNRLIEHLLPGGYLFLGHSERVPPATQGLGIVGPTTYRLDPLRRRSDETRCPATPPLQIDEDL